MVFIKLKIYSIAVVDKNSLGYLNHSQRDGSSFREVFEMEEFYNAPCDSLL